MLKIMTQINSTSCISLFIHKMLAPIIPSLVLMKDYQSYEIFPLIYNSFLTLQ